MGKRTHFWPTLVSLWQKRYHTLGLNIWFALRKLCSQLLCASGRFGESQPGECKKGCLYSVTVPAFAGKSLNGVERGWEKRNTSRKIVQFNSRKMLRMRNQVDGNGKDVSSEKSKGVQWKECHYSSMGIKGMSAHHNHSVTGKHAVTSREN